MAEVDEHSCKTCEYGEWYRHGYDITMMDDECGGCCSWNDKWKPKRSEEEAIPKDQYENRLKADMVAMLDELDLELYEQYDDTDLIKVKYVRQAIQQKINALKGE